MGSEIVAFVAGLATGIALGWVIRDRSLAKQALDRLSLEFHHVSSSLSDKFDQLRIEISEKVAPKD